MKQNFGLLSPYTSGKSLELSSHAVSTKTEGLVLDEHNRKSSACSQVYNLNENSTSVERTLWRQMRNTENLYDESSDDGLWLILWEPLFLIELKLRSKTF